MKWFKGDVVAASRESRRRSCLILVYLSKTEAQQTLFEDDELAVTIVDNCVCLKLEVGSSLTKHFCEIYQVKDTPCIFMVGRTGSPLDVVEKNPDPKEFLSRLKSAVQMNGGTFVVSSNKTKVNKPVATNKASTEEPMEVSDNQSPETRSDPPKPPAASNCRIQFRLPDGSTSADSFPSASSLAHVWDKISQKLGLRSKEFSLAMAHPRRRFDESDFSRTLIDLNLVPSAVLLVIPNATSPGGSAGIFGKLFSAVLGIVMGIWNFFIQLLGGGNNQIQGPPSSEQSAEPGARSRGDRWQAKRSRQGEPKEIRKRREGNITRLSAVQDDSSDDDATWNGNSTQQM